MVMFRYDLGFGFIMLFYEMLFFLMIGNLFWKLLIEIRLVRNEGLR